MNPFLIKKQVSSPPVMNFPGQIKGLVFSFVLWHSQLQIHAETFNVKRKYKHPAPNSCKDFECRKKYTYKYKLISNSHSMQRLSYCKCGKKQQVGQRNISNFFCLVLPATVVRVDHKDLMTKILFGKVHSHCIYLQLRWSYLSE